MTRPAPPEIMFDAKLLEHDPDLEPQSEPGSWFITHGLGTPAGGTFTEVAFDDTRHPDEVFEPIVRTVAVQLYGNAWAFTYRPEQYDEAIKRHGMRLRERVLVTGIEVLS